MLAKNIHHGDTEARRKISQTTMAPGHRRPRLCGLAKIFATGNEISEIVIGRKKPTGNVAVLRLYGRDFRKFFSRRDDFRGCNERSRGRLRSKIFLALP
jgi:hypothetical protein